MVQDELLAGLCRPRRVTAPRTAAGGQSRRAGFFRAPPGMSRVKTSCSRYTVAIRSRTSSWRRSVSIFRMSVTSSGRTGRRSRARRPATATANASALSGADRRRRQDPGLEGWHQPLLRPTRHPRHLPVLRRGKSEPDWNREAPGHRHARRFDWAEFTGKWAPRVALSGFVGDVDLGCTQAGDCALRRGPGYLFLADGFQAIQVRQFDIVYDGGDHLVWRESSDVTTGEMADVQPPS